MMRAPDTKALCAALDDRSRYYTDEQWQGIRNSLKAVSVDAYTVRIHARLGEGEVLLRDGLSLIALDCDIAARKKKVFPSPNRAAADLNQTIKMCNNLLVRLDDPFKLEHTHIDPDTQHLKFPYLSSQAHRARAELTSRTGTLSRRVNRYRWPKRCARTAHPLLARVKARVGRNHP
jgi:hypothetical protein